MDDFAKVVGENIKVMRAKRKMSQAELAFAAKINQSYLSRIENGTVNVSAIKLYIMAATMKCSVVELLPPQNL